MDDAGTNARKEKWMDGWMDWRRKGDVVFLSSCLYLHSMRERSYRFMN